MESVHVFNIGHYFNSVLVKFQLKILRIMIKIQICIHVCTCVTIKRQKYLVISGHVRTFSEWLRFYINAIISRTIVKFWLFMSILSEKNLGTLRRWVFLMHNPHRVAICPVTCMDLALFCLLVYSGFYVPCALTYILFTVETLCIYDFESWKIFISTREIPLYVIGYYPCNA